MKNIKISLLATIIALCHGVTIKATFEHMYKQLEALHQINMANYDAAQRTAIADRIVMPFNESVHGADARSIFHEAFNFQPLYLQSDEIVKKSRELQCSTLVLLLKNKVIGLIAYYDEYDPETLETVRYLERVVVDKKHRGLKVSPHGEFLVETLENMSLNDDIAEIRLTAANPKLVSFYKKLNYEIDSGFNMQKTLCSEDNTRKAL